MKLHKGKILKEAIEDSGVSITHIINKLKKYHKHIKCSRTKLYYLFKQEEIDPSFLKAIGKMIYYDFSKEIPELKDKNEADDDSQTNYDLATKSEIIFIRHQHNRLQRSYIGLLSLLTKIANENNDEELKKEIEFFLNKGYNKDL